MSTPEAESVDESLTSKKVHHELRDRWWRVLLKWTVGLCLCVAMLVYWRGVAPGESRGASTGVAPPAELEDWPEYSQPLTRGELWPRPQIQHKSDFVYTFDASQLEVKVVGHTCRRLTRAIKRYKDVWHVLNQLRVQQWYRNEDDDKGRLLPPYQRSGSYQGIMGTLALHLTTPCDAEYPYYKMDESYILTVSNSTTLKANSIWGLLRAFETFNQLLYYSDDYQEPGIKELLLNETHISDYPRYAHRGLLLDTGRHHLSVYLLQRTLDAMAMNKMNVLHWHIVDDESFPYVSRKFPKLSERGAFDERLVYSAADIRKLLEYAADLGIRVIPEFDVPGHTLSWGEAYPELMTKCYLREIDTGLGLLNPIKPDVYKLLKELFEEVQELFPDKFFHIGGDEVNRDCWESNLELAEYMEEHNVTSQHLHSLFMQRVMTLLAPGTTPVVWQDVFFEKGPLSNTTVVQIWKFDNISTILKQVIDAGHEVLYSSAWYLDRLENSARSMYVIDPRLLVPPEMAPHIVGGEACMWGEKVNDTNVLFRVWPRASAVAEVLWSAAWPRPGEDREVAEEHIERAMMRLEEHTRRMTRLGILA